MKITMITKLMTLKEIQAVGGFEKLKKLGYEYYELYHKTPDGNFEGHNLYEIYSKN